MKINEHKRLWRTAVLIIFLISIIGPWAFERINVPAEFACSQPYIRLEGDFCGIPVSGAQVFFFFIITNFLLIVKLVPGEIEGVDLFRALLLTALFLFLLLPVFTTLLLILRNKQQSKLAVSLWGLAVGIILFLTLSVGLEPILLTWGIWLFIGLGVASLLLELSLLRINHNANQEIPPFSVLPIQEEP